MKLLVMQKTEGLNNCLIKSVILRLKNSKKTGSDWQSKGQKYLISVETCNFKAKNSKT